MQFDKLKYKTPCGRMFNGSGKQYTIQGLLGHVKECDNYKCQQLWTAIKSQIVENLDNATTQESDISDGALFSMKFEGFDV